MYNQMLFHTCHPVDQTNPHSCFVSKIFSDFMRTSSDQYWVLFHTSSNIHLDW